MKIKRNGNYALKIVVAALLIFYTVMLASLIFYGFYTSLKSFDEFVYNTWRLPDSWHFENYATIFKYFKIKPDPDGPTYYLESLFGMSVVYSLLGASASVIATFLMAYACSQFACKFSKLIYFLVMFMIVVPIIGAYPSEYKMINDLGIYNKIGGVFFLKFNFGSIYFLLIYEALRGIPNDYREAAQVDGASLFRIMLQIILPMCSTVLSSVFLVQFVAFWNDYQTPLLYFPKVPNLAVCMLNFAKSTSGPIAGEPYKMGSCFVVVLPILIIFVAFQDKLMNNISGGGIKG